LAASGLNNTVYAIAVSGTNVYVGGAFTTAGGLSASRIARWNGSTWSALGSGVDSTVRAIMVSGSDLYVAGAFTNAGPALVNRIAKWNSSGWSALGSGVDGTVRTIAVSGSDVYVGGYFTTAGGKGSYDFGIWHAPLPSIESFRISGTDVMFQMPSAIGSSYQSQVSASLSQPNWQPLGASQNGTGGPLTFTEAGGATNRPSRFYRVRITTP
jgi:hypothetical protein